MGDGPDHSATEAGYDAVADSYWEHFHDELAGKPLDRALLGAVVETAAAAGPVADLGCGPGHVAGWLAARGVPAVGVDVSGAMVAEGRRRYPGVEFRQGDLTVLPAADGEFAAAVALYCVIHLTAGELAVAFAEMRRVLAPGGPVLVSFHVGSEVRHRDEWWGRPVDLDFRFYEVADVLQAMEGAGLEVEARLERRHHPGEVETRRAYLLGRRPG